MKITPIIDLEVPYFERGRHAGTVTLERGFDVPVTILRRYRDMLDCILEDEEDKVEVRQVPVRMVQILGG